MKMTDLWISTTPESEPIIHEIENAPDRHAAIVLCAFLEDQLKNRIKRGLRKPSDTVDSLLNPTGPIGTLFAKNSLAYAMEIYDDDTRHNIKLIGDIRNAFAHRTVVKDFVHKDINDLCDQFRFNPHHLAGREQLLKAGYKPEAIKGRAAFMFVATGILTTLTWSGEQPQKYYVRVPSRNEPSRHKWIEFPTPESPKNGEAKRRGR